MARGRRCGSYEAQCPAQKPRMQQKSVMRLDNTKVTVQLTPAAESAQIVPAAVSALQGQVAALRRTVAEQAARLREGEAELSDARERLAEAAQGGAHGLCDRVLLAHGAAHHSGPLQECSQIESQEEDRRGMMTALYQAETKELLSRLECAQRQANVQRFRLASRDLIKKTADRCDRADAECRQLRRELRFAGEVRIVGREAFARERVAHEAAHSLALMAGQRDQDIMAGAKRRAEQATARGALLAAEERARTALAEERAAALLELHAAASESCRAAQSAAQPAAAPDGPPSTPTAARTEAAPQQGPQPGSGAERGVAAHGVGHRHDGVHDRDGYAHVAHPDFGPDRHGHSDVTNADADRPAPQPLPAGISVCTLGSGEATDAWLLESIRGLVETELSEVFRGDITQGISERCRVIALRTDKQLKSFAMLEKVKDEDALAELTGDQPMWGSLRRVPTPEIVRRAFRLDALGARRGEGYGEYLLHLLWQHLPADALIFLQPAPINDEYGPKPNPRLSTYYSECGFRIVTPGDPQPVFVTPLESDLVNALEDHPAASVYPPPPASGKDGRCCCGRRRLERQSLTCAGDPEKAAEAMLAWLEDNQADLVALGEPKHPQLMVGVSPHPAELGLRLERASRRLAAPRAPA